ncbi:metallophosphoesterase [Tateyamaria sp.]|uniref:metallophosphoesterase n=1 Tax=Tateyamaria sp. TaxID=1929288 RepID=UPI00329D690A
MIRKLLRRLTTGPEFPAIAPDSPFVAVGDIHGRADLLKRFLDMGQTYPVICVGDYVDRGDESAEVLQLLQQRPDINCLSGNHEEMMLDFLKNPEKAGPRWLRYGGLQTLASFGVAGVSDTSVGTALISARDALEEAMGPELITWLNNLPTRWQSGNVAVVHAGADPARSISGQNIKALHWGHPDFSSSRRKDGLWIIHGHTIVEDPIVRRGRIAIDTGAYATGRLTAVLVEHGKTTFQTITQ